MTTFTLTCDGATFDEMLAAFTDAMQHIRAGGLSAAARAAPDRQRPAMLTLTFTCHRDTTAEVLEAMEDASRFIPDSPGFSGKISGH